VLIALIGFGLANAKIVRVKNNASVRENKE
jgi:hypothetical protein